MDLIANFWPAKFRELFGGTFPPEQYVCVDCETTGFAVTEDLITEWGHVFIADNKEVDRLSLIIDWSDREMPPDWWVQQRLIRVKNQMEAVGKSYHVTYDKMKAEGMKPAKAFEFIREFTSVIKAKGIPFVFHNGLFDEKMLSAKFLQFGFGKGFSFGDCFLDTGAIEKASQLLGNSRMYPKTGDTLRDYFSRVTYTRVAGVLSNLDDHCYTKYKFREKHGIKPTDMHSAVMDCYCCHLLMQEYAALVTAPIAPAHVDMPPSQPGRPVPAAPRPRAVGSEPQLGGAGQQRIRGTRNS